MATNSNELETLSRSLLSLVEEHSMQAVVNSRLRNDGETLTEISRLGLESLKKDRYLGGELLGVNSYFDMCQAIADGPSAFALYKA